ncbi:MAG: hypothetical protein ACOVNY_12770 [Chitinophagaceae bacterium]
MLKKYVLYIILIVCFFTIACKKQVDSNGIIQLNDYYPLKVGSVFIYRLDSTLPSTFGASLVKRYYLAKDSVESIYTDASGRKAFRIFRYLTDTLATKPYEYKTTLAAVFSEKTVEFVDNNLRFITLANPISINTIWKGNSYINGTPITPNGTASYGSWDYQYMHINKPFTVKKGTIDSTVFVQHVADSTGVNFDPNFIYGKNYSVEVYAKGVGLIYKDFLCYFYQTTPIRTFEEGSFGIRLSLVSYK